MRGPVVARRAFVAGGCLFAASGASAERVRPAGLRSLVGTSYRPVDADEKGIWQELDRFEQDLAGSPLLLDAPGLKRSVDAVMARLLGAQAADTRVYLVRDASFNASMAPNGMMIVQTGLLARVRDEAQLAAVLGHECGHYLRRHSVQRWRDMKTKTGVMAFVGAIANVGVGVTAMAGGGYASQRSWVDLANSVNTSIALSLFRFSREQEAEADAYGAKLMDAAGYPPDAAPQIWLQYIEERRASAAVRHKRYKDGSRSVVSDHPPTEERLADLTMSARELRATSAADRVYDARRDGWRATVAPWRSGLLREQVMLNDPGASLYLLDALAADGWDGTLRFYQGEVFRLRDEPGDAGRAAEAFAVATALPDVPPEAWRAHGYACLKAGRADEGRRALAKYLEAAPNATDAAMVRASIS